MVNRWTGEPQHVVYCGVTMKLKWYSSCVADLIMLFVWFPISFHLIPWRFNNPYHFFDSILLSFYASWEKRLPGPDEPDLLYFAPRFATLKGDKRKSPKRQLRALCKSDRKHPEAPYYTFLIIAPSGCLQGRRHARRVTYRRSMSMVRASILHLPKLLERPGLLLWYLSPGGKTEKTPAGATKISANRKRQKGPSPSRKSPQAR